MNRETQKMPVGKYKGVPVCEVPTKYLRWYLYFTDIEHRRPWLADAIRSHLKQIGEE